MKQEISYKVYIWDENHLGNEVTEQFSVLKEALDYIEKETEKLFFEYGTFTYFAIEIINLDSHKHVLFFEDDRGYRRDNNVIDTFDLDGELLESDEKYLYNFIEGYIQGLISC